MPLFLRLKSGGPLQQLRQQQQAVAEQTRKALPETLGLTRDQLSDEQRQRLAEMYERLTYLDVLSNNLEVMDSTAISLCMDNELPIIVFNLRKRGNMKGVIMGDRIGTLIANPDGLTRG